MHWLGKARQGTGLVRKGMALAWQGKAGQGWALTRSASKCVWQIVVKVTRYMGPVWLVVSIHQVCVVMSCSPRQISDQFQISFRSVSDLFQTNVRQISDRISDSVIKQRVNNHGFWHTPYLKFVRNLSEIFGAANTPFFLSQLGQPSSTSGLASPGNRHTSHQQAGHCQAKHCTVECGKS